jgi:hypothetical protein
MLRMGAAELEYSRILTVFAKTGKLKAGTHILGVSRGGFGPRATRRSRGWRDSTYYGTQ